MNLEGTIKRVLDEIPIWCKEDVATHEWKIAYGDPPGDFHYDRTKRGVQMLPYYVCKHCHAVSNNKIDSPWIKRVR